MLPEFSHIKIMLVFGFGVWSRTAHLFSNCSIILSLLTGNDQVMEKCILLNSRFMSCLTFLLNFSHSFSSSSSVFMFSWK